MRKVIPATVATVLAVLAALPLHAAVTVRADRDPLLENESVTVTFVVTGDTREEPDFSPVERDFEILTTSRTSKVRVENDSVSSETVWSLTLLPRRAGRLAVPPVDFGGGELSPTLDLTVKPSASATGPGADLRLEADVSTRRAWVQQQVVLTLQVWRAINPRTVSLSEPRVEGTEILLRQLGEDVVFDRLEGGRRYRVVERRYVIFPQASGQIRIAPFRLDAQLSGIRGRKIVRVETDPIEIDVRPIPADFPGRSWLPARNLTLEERWSDEPDSVEAGAALTRTLTITADGLTAAQLPEIDVVMPDSIRAYPDQPKLEDRVENATAVGVREERMALIPALPGEVVLPAVEVPWWNVDTERVEVAIVPERTLRVLPAPTSAMTPAPPVPPPGAATPAAGAGTIQASASQRTWQWIAAVAVLGWIATLGLWAWRSRSATGRVRATARGAGAREGINARRRVLDACRSGNAEAAGQALLAWGRRQWPGESPRSLAAIARLCPPALAEEIEGLARRLYGGGGQWQGTGLASAFAQFKNPRRRRRGARAGEGLEPLYKA